MRSKRPTSSKTCGAERGLCTVPGRESDNSHPTRYTCGLYCLLVSDEPKETYTAREIVLEFFPATPKHLIPRTNAYRLERGKHSEVVICDRSGCELLRLIPVKVAGASTSQLCCDFCFWSGIRQYLQAFRVEVPGSAGRRFRYVTICRDTEACEARRFDDKAVEALLRIS